jgi:hypothetical protein
MHTMLAVYSYKDRFLCIWWWKYTENADENLEKCWMWTEGNEEI